MVKISPEQKTEIITLKLQGMRAPELMSKFGISRAYVYKIMNENNIAYSEVNTNIDITEINEMVDSDDIFNDLNDNQQETIETYKPNSPKPEIEPEIEQPQIQKPQTESPSEVAEDDDLPF